LPEILQEIGAYAGMASVVGLAVLSALYFSQARDVKRLREWAGRAPERSEQGAPVVPGRVVAQPQQPGATPPPAAAPPPVPGKPATPGTPARPAPATPAGQAAPAAAAAAGAGAATAQQSKPTAVPVPAAQNANAGAAAAQSGAAASGAAAGSPSGAAAGEAKPDDGTAADAKPGAAAAGAPAAGAAASPPAPGAPAAGGAKPPEGQPGAAKPADAKPADAKPAATAAGSAPATPQAGGAAPTKPSPQPPAASAAPSAPSPPAPTRPAPPSPPVSPPRRQAATPAGGRGSGAPSVPPGDSRFASRPGVTSRHSPQETAILPPRPSQGSRIRGRYLAIVLAGLLVLGGAAAYGVTQLTGDDDGSSTGGAAAVESGKSDSGQSKQKQGGAVRPGSVTVAVLNGTTVPGLAATLSDEVGKAGFKVGTITNFSDQQLAESVVQYAPGHEAEGRAVSRRLGIGQREPVNPSSQALAGDATVIVIAGADKAP
jgi:hypothetical protein